MIKMQTASSLKPRATEFIHEQGPFKSPVTTYHQYQRSTKLITLHLTTLPAKITITVSLRINYQDAKTLIQKHKLENSQKKKAYINS